MKRLFLVLALVACSDPMGVVDPVEFTREQPLLSPPIYRQWFAEVEACSGLRGNFDAIHFYTARLIVRDEIAFSGYWYGPAHIVIREDMIYSEWLVKHEQMHELLQSGDHPAKYFNGMCGDLLGPDLTINAKP